MTVSIIVCVLACIGLIVSVLIKPSVCVKGKSIDIYWFPAFAGALFLLIFGILPIKEAWHGLTASGTMNPLKILSLFLSLTFLSVFLDELGFFKKLASMLIKRAGGSQKKLFILLYLLVSVLTVFTSNDIVVLTFTPFICCFCKEENVSPVPYLVGEFVAANTWSMMLIIGNPTNVYVSGSFGIGFAEYLSVMWLPTLLSGSVALLVLWLLFKKTLSLPLSPTPEECEIADKPLLIINVVLLSVCIILLAISSYIGFEMWLVSVISAVSLIIIALGYALCFRKKNSLKLLGCSLKRAPWQLVPFVLSMFIIVLSLEKYGVTSSLNGILSGKGDVIKYGVSSFLASNIVNNIPMSVLFSGILGTSASAGSVYATVIGSNLGAYLTPVGALAGIMWTGLLKKYDVKFGFASFIKYGVILAIPSLIFALLGLYIII